MQHPDDDLERSEIEALAATRAELGAEYDAALLSSFADRVEVAIDQRVRWVLAESHRTSEVARRRDGQQTTLGILSVVAAIPISIVLGLNEELTALLVAWIGIVAVNLAHAMAVRRAREVRPDR